MKHYLFRFNPGLGEFQHHLHGLQDTLSRHVLVLGLGIPFLVDDVCQYAPVWVKKENPGYVVTVRFELGVLGLLRGRFNSF